MISSLKMFPKVAVVLATLIYSGIGIPLELEPQHDMKRFLSSRIVGGIEAPPGYGNHMAALVWGETFTHLMCGGSIISSQHILTAAHCIDPLIIWGELIPSFRAVIGSKRWASTENNIKFAGHINHPEFSWSTLKNDIGLLFLESVITPSDNVNIIPLKADWMGGGVEVYVTGWGRLGAHLPVSDTKQLLHMNTLSSEKCYDALNIVSGGQYAPPLDPKIEICTLHSVGHGMCNGDSGSGLVHNKTRTLIGIVSWGWPCATGAPDVFVRTSAFLGWITKNMSRNLYNNSK